MAHEVETMAYAGAVPWHGLGKRVHHDLTPDQMLEEAGLNWKVFKQPTYYKIPAGFDPANNQPIFEERLSTDMALVRDSDFRQLDTVSGPWEPVQNEEAAAFFHEFVMAGKMEMHTAGSLQSGRKVWFLAKTKEAFELFKKDLIEQYLLFTNHHQYGYATDIRETDVRVVCANTLAQALGGKKGDLNISVSHRNKFDPEKVKETLGLSKKTFEAYKEKAEFISTRRFTDETLEEYFDTVFPSMAENGKAFLSRNATRALEVVDTQPGAELGEGTWWQAFNAVTYTTDHLFGRSQDSRITAAWYGENRGRKIKALQLAVDMAEKSASN